MLLTANQKNPTTIVLDNVIYPSKKVLTPKQKQAKHDLLCSLGFSATPVDFAYSHEYGYIEEKLIAFMESENIDLILVGGDDSPAMNYYKPYRVACVSFTSSYLYDSDDAKRLIVLAHELGHYLDYHYSHLGFDNKNFNSYFIRSMYDEFGYELTAWYYAEQMLDALGFKDWQKFVDLKIYALTTYAHGDEQVLNHILDNESAIVKQHLEKEYLY